MERIGVSSEHVYSLGDIAQYLFSKAQGEEGSYVYDNTQEIRQQIEEMSAQLGLSTSKGNHYVPIGRVAGKPIWRQLSFFTDTVMSGLSQYANSYLIERLEWDGERGYYTDTYRVSKINRDRSLAEIKDGNGGWMKVEDFKLRQFDNVTSLERIGGEVRYFMTANDAIHSLVNAQPGDELSQTIRSIKSRYPTLTARQLRETREQLLRLNTQLASPDGEERLAAESEFKLVFATFKRVALRVELLDVLKEEAITGRRANRLRTAITEQNVYLMKLLSGNLPAISNLLPINETKGKRYIKIWADCLHAFQLNGFTEVYEYMLEMWSVAEKVRDKKRRSRWGAIRQVVETVEVA